jgi:hypothetical protein
MKDAYWEPHDDYETEVSKGPDAARAVYRELGFTLGIGRDLGPQARKFLAERLRRVGEMDDCAEALGLKRARKRPAITAEERNRFLVEMEVLTSKHHYGISQEKASEILGEYHCREKSKFKKLRKDYPNTASFIRQQIAAGYVLAWSKLPDDLVHLITEFSPDSKL